MPKIAPNQSRLPIIKPAIQAVPPRFVSKVMSNHYRTLDKASESSKRARNVVEMSEETIQRAKATLGTWRAANEKLD